MKRSWDGGHSSAMMGSIAAMASAAVITATLIGWKSLHGVNDPPLQTEVLAAEEVGRPLLTPEAGPRQHGAVAAMDLAGLKDLVEVYPPSREEAIILARRRDGRSGRVIWQLDLNRAHPPASVDVAEWKRNIESDWRDFYDHTEPTLVRPAPDLDGDGTRDLVCAGIRPPSYLDITRDPVGGRFRHPPLLLALSGKDGTELWWFHAVPDEPSRPAAPIPTKEDQPKLTEARLIGVPAVTEIDGDGTPDFVATFLMPWREQVPGRANQPAKSWVEAISGRAGRSLWRCPLDTTWFAANRVGQPQLFPAEVARVGDQSTAVVVAGTRVVLIDVKSGTPIWIHRLPVGLGSRQVTSDGIEISTDSMAIQVKKLADLDGDGLLDVLLLCKGPALSNVIYHQFLEAISLQKRRTLWRIPVTKVYDDNSIELGWVPGQAPDWPIVTDLDGDRQTEVVLLAGVHQPGDFDALILPRGMVSR